MDIGTAKEILRAEYRRRGWDPRKISRFIAGLSWATIHAKAREIGRREMKTLPDKRSVRGVKPSPAALVTDPRWKADWDDVRGAISANLNLQPAP